MKSAGTYISPAETGQYFLERRYYNPTIGRFINADAYVATGTGLLGYNMFAYCNNNPVNFVDSSGYFAECFLDDCDLNDGLDNGMCGGGGRGAGPYHYKGASSTAGRSLSYSGGFSSGRYTSNNSATRTYGKGGKNTIPDKAKDIAKQIKANNGTPPTGYKGGRTFKNIPLERGAQKLPEGVNYKEYDINPYVKGQNRGVERIVMGDDGRVWYTGDHYYTFRQIE